MKLIKKKRQLIRRAAAGALCAALCFAYGCALLPEEEEHRSAPVVHEYNVQPYTFTSVMRGDMERKQTISCRYEPVKTETLSFGIGGVYYDTVYVNKGEYVTEGTLLASLQLGSLEENLRQREANLKRLNTQLLQTQALQRLQLQKQKLSIASAGLSGLDAADAEREYRRAQELELQSIQDNIAIEQLRIAEIQADIDKRQIRAGMDGTVTYIRTYKDGDRSTENATFMRISDTSSSMFSATTEYYDLFTPGEVVDITCKHTDYPAQYVTYDELGITPPEKEAGALKRTVYFRLLEPAVDLESGDRGSLVITLATRENVLYVYSKAVTGAAGHYYVYTVDGEGMRRLREVEIGLQTSEYTEILSGLEYGDEIIIE